MTEIIKGFENLSAHEQQWIATLRRRAEHLQARITTSPHDLSFDKQEVAAIAGLLGWIATHGGAAPDTLKDIIIARRHPPLAARHSWLDGRDQADRVDPDGDQT